MPKLFKNSRIEHIQRTVNIKKNCENKFGSEKRTGGLEKKERREVY